MTSTTLENTTVNAVTNNTQNRINELSFAEKGLCCLNRWN